MIIARLSDGLGNQMFQYAHGRALALRHGVPLRLDLSAYERDPKRRYGLDRFHTVQSFMTMEEAQRVITRPLDRTQTWWDQPVVLEPHFHYTEDSLRIPASCYLIGFWQSERHFAGIGRLLRLEFTPTTPLVGANLDTARAIALSNAVSLHVRRGDYVSDPRVIQLHGACSLDYYHRAAAVVAARVPDPTFFVFSDDPAWARENLRLDAPIRFVEHNGADPVEDLRLMSLCRHHVLANSSFSWWGAWLARHPEQVVAAPARWFAGYPHDTRDLVPDHWHRVEG